MNCFRKRGIRRDPALDQGDTTEYQEVLPDDED